MRTEEQQEHLRLLEERIRELEQRLLKQVANISRHLQSALDGGMEEYRTFVVEGRIYINIPEAIADKYTDIRPYYVSIVNEGNVEDDIRTDKELADIFDRNYFEHPEEYPADYIPMSRAYYMLIDSNLLHEQFNMDELMLIQPNAICSQVMIHI